MDFEMDEKAGALEVNEEAPAMQVEDDSSNEESSTPPSDESKVVENGNCTKNEQLEEKQVDLGPDYPKELNTLECFSVPIFVHKSKLTARYTGRGNHAHDVGSVRGDKPIPSVETVYYFEVTVEDPGFRGAITIGFSCANFALNKQCGVERGSYGYCGEDGRKYAEEDHGDLFGPFFTTGDVVGCGYSALTNSIFYTKNGALIGTAFENVSGELYPTVSLHSPGEVVSVNFGAAPFRFDCKGLVESERLKVQSVIEEIPVPNELYHPLVASYLAHAGYIDTLKAFQEAHGGLGEDYAAKYPALAERSQIRKLIGQGKIDEAMTAINKLVPNFAEQHPDTMCQIHCQKFLELARQGKTSEAVYFAQQTLSQYSSTGNKNRVLNVMGALAYINPQTYPLLHVDDSSAQDEVADSVNSALLESLGHAHYCQSPLERLASQLKVTEDFLSSSLI